MTSFASKSWSSWSYLCASTWGFSLFPRLLASALCLFWLCCPHLYFSVFPSSSFVLLRFFCLSLHLWDPPPFRITPEHDNCNKHRGASKFFFRSFFRGHLADFHLERYKQEFERRVCFRPSPLTFTTRRKPTQLVVLLHHETSLPTANESKEEEQGKTRIFSVCGRCCFVLFYWLRYCWYNFLLGGDVSKIQLGVLGSDWNRLTAFPFISTENDDLRCDGHRIHSSCIWRQFGCSKG